jgi:hypothetical protein
VRGAMDPAAIGACVVHLPVWTSGIFVNRGHD